MCIRDRCAQKLCIDGLIELHGQNIDFCYGITVFQVLRILLVYGRASSAGGNVFRSSQSTLCTTGVDQKVAIHGLVQYKWPEQGLKNLVVRARVSSMGGNAQMEPDSTISHCNGPRKCVFVF